MRFPYSSAAVAATVVLQATSVAALPQTDGKTAACCITLDKATANRVSFPSSAEYGKSVESYWAIQARQKPNCIFIPQSTADVSLAVKTLAKNSCKFAVRGGGHTPQADSGANIVDGITIDLSALNSVRVSDDKKTVSIGGGSRWIDAYTYLDARGLSTTGGRIADVGVGGLTTGGGNSFFAARYGFACDNVKEYEMVLGSGEIVSVNAQGKYKNLYKAMKGASNNFGIVTKFYMSAFEQGDFWGGANYHAWEPTADAHTDAFVKFTDNVANDPFGSVLHIRAYDQRQSTPDAKASLIANAMHYTKTLPDKTAPPVAPAAFKDFLAIPGEIAPLNTLRNSNLSDFTRELELGNRRGGRALFSTLTFANDLETMKQVDAEGLRLRAKYENVPGLQWYQIYQPLPASFSKLSAERGGNVLGLDRVQGNSIIFLFYLVWDRAEDDKDLYAVTEEYLSAVNRITGQQKSQRDFIYLNYAFPTQDPIGSYGDANVQFLKETSKTFDPNQVFQNLVPGGFKLSKVAKRAPKDKDGKDKP